MALNYSAEQYDQEFSSKRMQMWEVPKAELSKRPNQKGNLKFISNEHGHLLPEVRRSNRNPFGDFVGTWDMPKTIPGPYQLVTTGRTNKNIECLYNKKLSTDKAIEDARNNKNPCLLRSMRKE